MTNWRHGLLVSGAAVLAMAAGAGPALGIAPPNDDRNAARDLGAPPASVQGTTAGSTQQENEPRTSCGRNKGGVWYRIQASGERRLVVRVSAQGDLDAVFDVFRRERSQNVPISCDVTDRSGQAGLGFDAAAGEIYLVRVSAVANSVQGDFSVQVLLPRPPATPPGRPLPARGVSGAVDRVINPDDAWSAVFREGRTYRINLATSDCGAGLVIYGPGTTDFEAEALRTLSCGGYALLTPGPGESGRYSFLVQSDQRDSHPYHLQVAGAGADDTAPGLFVRNPGIRRGRLAGAGIDVADLYRFDVLARSNLDLNMSAGSASQFDLVLLTDTGRRVACGCGGSGSQQIRVQLGRGRYFAIVRAREGSGGRYTLRRLTRVLTRTGAQIDGRRKGFARPGRAVRLGVSVAPHASGGATFYIERFDPAAGWQYIRTIGVRVSGGSGSTLWVPPSIGRYRMYASYSGSRIESPSESNYLTLLVADPLED